MKVLNKTMNVICNLITKYFMIWCPKESATSKDYSDNSENEYEQSQSYYLSGTRWI